MSLQILRKGENEMAKKEVKTDLWVARQLDDSKIKYDAQGSDVKEINDGIQYLYHDDVLKLFCLLLDNAKFRRVFADKYPLILIDEYQDSYKPIIDRFVDYFIAKGIGPQFGFFGDAWQTIYQSNKACDAIEHDNIDVIKKSSNFRSSPRIVQDALVTILRAYWQTRFFGREKTSDTARSAISTSADHILGKSQPICRYTMNSFVRSGSNPESAEKLNGGLE